MSSAAISAVTPVEKKKRNRAENWTPAETEVMLECLEDNRQALFREHRGVGGSHKRKEEAWLRVSQLTSQVGVTARPPQACRNHWSLLKRDLKKKASKSSASVRKTGGGQAEDMPLTPLEERVLAIAGRDAIFGLLQGSSSTSPTHLVDYTSESACSTPSVGTTACSLWEPESPEGARMMPAPSTLTVSSKPSETKQMVSKKRKQTTMTNQREMLAIEEKRLALEERKVEALEGILKVFKVHAKNTHKLLEQLVGEEEAGSADMAELMKSVGVYKK